MNRWLGDTEASRGTGYFGLFRSCRLLQDGQDLICSGSVFSAFSAPSPSSSAPAIIAPPSAMHHQDGRQSTAITIVAAAPAFKAATIFVGTSVLMSIATIGAFILFFFLHSSTVFHICGWLQATNGTFIITFSATILKCFLALLLVSGLLVFPIGWDHPVIREVCGPGADIYAPGDCSVRWTLILAVIGSVDVSVLSLLSFMLGSRYVKLLEPKYVGANPAASSSLLIHAAASNKSSLLAGGAGGHVNGAFGPPPVLPLPVTLTSSNQGGGMAGRRGSSNVPSQMQL